jgi:hypothetical protein
MTLKPLPEAPVAVHQLVVGDDIRSMTRTSPFLSRAYAAG